MITALCVYHTNEWKWKIQTKCYYLLVLVCTPLFIVSLLCFIYQSIDNDPIRSELACTNVWIRACCIFSMIFFCFVPISSMSLSPSSRRCNPFQLFVFRFFFSLSVVCLFFLSLINKKYFNFNCVISFFLSCVWVYFI